MFFSHELLFYTAIGFNVETITCKNLKFQVWDLGGQTSIRFVSLFVILCRAINVNMKSQFLFPFIS